MAGRAALVLLLAALAGTARAQNEGDDGLRPLCTDRPTKSTGACTVDAGHFQLESDLVNATLDRSGGVDTDTWLFTNPTLKYGVTSNFDLEATLAPVVEVTTRDRSGGAKSSATGIGDLFLHAKLNLAGADGGALAVAVAPWLKLPTAKSGIGDGAVEEGVIVPVSYGFAENWSLSLDPEIDMLKDQAGNGRHAAIVNLVSVSRTLGEFTAAVEVWSNLNFEPAETIRQYSCDLGLSWIPVDLPDFQLDGGVNIGLNKATPDWQAYLGASRRF